ncbi:ligand-binding protein SH3 [Magnetospirillum moscoviense]|uniref:Ligand-binding protein SH3 n=1 Tax=Magnetospirillum moscoviense TaxID=1437059 RepID=A0A178MWE4_9PROT|nr:ligand-binding protein SH3 [Magnetospirillum moscoviense]OAN55152.1 ligand-binding protein SH3 [Magnetospirillum moscoviense]
MLISGFPSDGVITVNRVILKDGFDVDDLQERVALLCENVKTFHSDTGFIGGFVCLNAGFISNEGSTVGQAVESPLKDREALIVTFWRSFAEHEASHRSETFQPLFKEVLALCENGNEETGYNLLWQGAAYSAEDAAKARAAKGQFAA